MNNKKEDCYYYQEEKQMGATIPCCMKRQDLGDCPCENCNTYLSKSEVYKIIMKWEEYKNIMPETTRFEEKTQVNVECPVCGKKIWRRNDIVLTTYPAQYRYECECGWWGSAYK